MAHRYALYLAPPPDSEWHLFARAWLGRDAITGETVAQPAVEHVPADRLREITASARRYGFHGTIKPPFRLAAGRTDKELRAAARAFAAGAEPFTIDLEVQSLRGFLAFMPSRRSPELDGFAAACVGAFEPFRAPLTATDLERRRRAALTPRQLEHLEEWGYPYVMEDFAFHMTLTDRLANNLHDRVLTDLCARTRALTDGAYTVQDLCLFEEPERGAAFRLTERFPLGG